MSFKRVEGLRVGVRVWGLRFGVEGVVLLQHLQQWTVHGVRVQGLGVKIWGLGFNSPPTPSTVDRASPSMRRP